VHAQASAAARKIGPGPVAKLAKAPLGPPIRHDTRVEINQRGRHRSSNPDLADFPRRETDTRDCYVSAARPIEPGFTRSRPLSTGLPAGGAQQPGRPEARPRRVDAPALRTSVAGAPRPPAHHEVEQGRRHGAHARAQRAQAGRPDRHREEDHRRARGGENARLVPGAAKHLGPLAI
jgi:hypothetical protein